MPTSQANFLDPAPQPARWQCAVENGRSVARYPGDVYIAGQLIFDGSGGIQAAIDAAFARGGGLVVVGASQNVSATITLRSRVVVDVAPGVTLTWTGGAGTMFTTPSDNVIEQAGLTGYGATFNAQNATYALRVYSAWKCNFAGFKWIVNNAAGFVMDLRGDASSGSNPALGRQSAYNTFTNILCQGIAGTFLRLYGVTASSGYVTLNTFTALGAEYCAVRGIDFAQWCDSNYFAGKTRVNLGVNNAVGIEYNTADPLNNVGVYTNNFADLAVDTFNPGSFLGRVGIKINNAKDISVYNYYNTPVAEGGSLVVAAAAGAYDIRYFEDATATILQLSQKHEQQGTQTNDDAPAGFIGEYLSSEIVSGSATALVSDTAKTVTSITLTAGDWDVEGIVKYTGNAATTVAYAFACTSLTTNNIDGGSPYNQMQILNGLALGAYILRIVAGTRRRVKVAKGATTTVYLVAQAGFGVNTLSAFGLIQARRVR